MKDENSVKSWWGQLPLTTYLRSGAPVNYIASYNAMIRYIFFMLVAELVMIYYGMF